MKVDGFDHLPVIIVFILHRIFTNMVLFDVFK